MLDTDKIDPRFEGDLPQLSKMLTGLRNAAYGVSRDVTVKNLEMSEESMRHFDEVRSCVIRTLNYGHECLAMRDEYRREIFDRYDYTLISLGFDCLPRTLAAKYGLIQTRSAGRLTCPFDLSVHPLPALNKLLLSDFALYGDSEKYEVTPDGMPRHKGMNILFNHDTDPSYVAGGFKALIAANMRRADNFRQYASRSNAVFALHVRAQDMAHLDEFCIIVTDKFPTALFAFISTGDKAVEVPTGLQTLSIHSPLPRAEYKWFMVDSFATPEGAAFERRIVGELANFIRENCPQR